MKDVTEEVSRADKLFFLKNQFRRQRSWAIKQLCCFTSKIKPSHYLWLWGMVSDWKNEISKTNREASTEVQLGSPWRWGVPPEELRVNSQLLHIKRSQLVSGKDAFRPTSKACVSDMPHWYEASGQSQDVLESFYIKAGLGRLQRPPRRAG